MQHNSCCLLTLFASACILSACATPADIQDIADKTVIEVPDGKSARPVQFKRIVIKMKRGADIGSVQAGIFCAPRRDLIYRGGRRTIGGDELTETFQEELRGANYTVVGDPDALFEDPSAWKAEYLIAGLVKDMRANVCYPLAGWGDLVNGRGEASMEVEWHIYSRLDRKVVYKTKTSGRSDIKDSMPSPEIEVFMQAFLQQGTNFTDEVACEGQ